MKYINKTLGDRTFEFEIDAENNTLRIVTIVIRVARHQEQDFEKFDNSSDILKQIAIETAFSIDKYYKLKLNNYDSGIEWHGQFEISKS